MPRNGYLARMLTTLTIRCDWPGCQATLTYEFRLLRPHEPGWKTETEGAYSMHLCPAHCRKSWDQVRQAQFAGGQLRNNCFSARPADPKND